MVGGPLQTNGTGQKSFVGHSSQRGLRNSGHCKGESVKGRRLGWDEEPMFRDERPRRQPQLASEGGGDVHKGCH